MAELNDKQLRFIDEYLIDLNATQAAIRSGYSHKTANEQGSRLLANVNIQHKINEAMKEREKRTEVTQDMIIKELAKIAFSNGTDFARVVEKTERQNVYDEEGEIIGQKEVIYKDVELVETDLLPNEKKDVISSIKRGRNGIEVASYDKLKALELLGKHLGIFTDKLEANVNENLTIKVTLSDD